MLISCFIKIYDSIKEEMLNRKVDVIMKRIFSFILFGLLAISIVACSKEKPSYGFEDKEWIFYDEVTAEHEKMILGSDGSYSYYCDCGEPVGNSDSYDQYEYNPESGMITLSNGYDDLTAEIEVMDYNEYHLLLKIDGEIRDFALGEMDASANFFMYEGEKYLKGYESRCMVVDMKEDHIVYGPIDYDPEGSYKDGPFEQYELAENVPVFELTIKRYLSVQDDQEYEEDYEVEYTELSQEEIQYILDSGVGSAFLWFDDEMKVEKIVFWGQLSVTVD